MFIINEIFKTLENTPGYSDAVTRLILAAGGEGRPSAAHHHVLAGTPMAKPAMAGAGLQRETKMQQVRVFLKLHPFL